MVLIAPSDASVPPTLPPNAELLDVAPTPVSRPIPAGFIGLSIEYPSSLAYSGNRPGAPNSTFIKLVQELNPSGSPIIRFGGDTTDWTWWPTRGVKRPPGIRYALTRRWLAVTRATARALDARLILGINLEADRATVARAEAEAFMNGIGRSLIMGFELGNEPEVYGRLGWYTTQAGIRVPGRPARYDLGSYLIDYAAISSALPRNVPLVGPASGSPGWMTALSRYLAGNPRVAHRDVSSLPAAQMLHRARRVNLSDDFEPVGPEELARPGVQFAGRRPRRSRARFGAPCR